jgi:hypothetical protein
MPNSINSISPSFRDYLLLKNLVTDTVVDNGLQSLLSGIGYPVATETLPNAVQPSNSINNTGTLYQELNTILNTYQGNEDDYSQVDIILTQSTNNTIGNQGIYANSNELLNGQFVYNGGLTNSELIREGLTSKNIYVDVPKQSVINLNTQPVPTFQNLTSYIDENNNLSIGGPGTQAADVLAGLVSGQGVGLNVTNGSLIANGDIRSSLLGRTLGATGVINDTPLGNVGGQQLLAHVGYNAAFGLQQETLGSLNLNPLTLIQGKPLITLNYSITVPKGTLGKIVNFAANVFGLQSPISLLENSIFTFGDKLDYLGITNIERANLMIKNSGQGQVKQLIAHMNSNLNIPKLPFGENLRQGYAPTYTGLKNTGENTEDGTNGKIYARTDGKGFLIDFLNGKENSPISSGNYERSEQISADGWNEDYFNTNIQETFDGGIIKDGFTWYSETINNQNDVDINGNSLGDKFGKTENSKKTLLYKTQSLFKSGNIKSLVSGHGIIDIKSQINSSVSSVGGYTSKGSGVMSESAVINGNDNGPENVFCRTWTSNDRYNKVGDLQKHRGLYGDIHENIYRKNVENSVLDDNGFVKISPLKTYDKDGVRQNEVKKYMFSIENLAWCDDLSNLLPCEIGPGDLLSGHKGRIMWFPPYEINFSESTSASWDKQNFIGRGEPMYTYNNTERTGNLGWKIIIDHPNYLNFIDKNTSEGTKFDDYVASFFAGCIPLENAPVTQNERDKAESANAQQKPVENLKPETEPPSFKIYFPNDVYDLNTYPNYENGLQNPGTDPILYKNNVTGSNFGIVEYSELCYKYKNNDIEVWSSSASTPNCKATDGKVGRTEPDRTNFGLNATGTTTQYTNAKIGDKKYKSWKDPEYIKDLQDYLLNQCKNCKVEILGYASNVGSNELSRNEKLSDLRAQNVKEWLLKNVLTIPPLMDRVSIKKVEGLGSVSGCKTLIEKEYGSISNYNKKRVGNYKKSLNDKYPCKEDRYVEVKFVVDPNLKTLENPKTPETNTPENNKQLNVSPSRFYSECDYFKKLSDTDPIAYNSIKDKIIYFQPAFHSTTPEGFNARLNFLQQCMRQGPTEGGGATNNPNNLAFGRPPVCILRIGDFYHTKIIIENLNFTFEPLVWDLNPEGVGVQPMICNVDMSFSFIGGSSLKGPINKLQNAVSFNYFANTEIYDPRADEIITKEIKVGEKTEYKNEILPGIPNISGKEKNKIPNPSDITGLSPNTEPVKDQVIENANVNTGENTQTIKNPDETIFSNSAALVNYRFQIDYSGDKLAGTFGILSGDAILTKEYDAKVKLAQGNVDIATFKIKPDANGKPNFGEFISDSGGWKSTLSEAANNGDFNSVTFVVEVPEFKIKFTSDRTTYSIARFDCPGEDMKSDDIVDYNDFKDIIESDNPCALCYPNGTGGKKRIINGYLCS